MPIIELGSGDFTRVHLGSGSFASGIEQNIYIVDSVLEGSSSGTGSLKVDIYGNIQVKWIVGNPPINFGRNVRIGIAIKFLSFSPYVVAGIFIGNNEVGIYTGFDAYGNPAYYLWNSFAGSLQITPNYFEQIILRQEIGTSVSYYSFSNQNTKNLVATLTASSTNLGQAGFFVRKSSAGSISVLFDYFFIEEYIGA